MQEAAHDGVVVAGAVIVEVGLFVVAPALEKVLISYYGITYYLRILRVGLVIGNCGHAEGVIGYAFDQISAVVGNGGDGTNGVCMKIVGYRIAGFVIIDSNYFIYSIAIYVLLHHLV